MKVDLFLLTGFLQIMLLTGCASVSTLSVTDIHESDLDAMRPLIVQTNPGRPLPDRIKVLLAYLASADIDKLVKTPAHAQGIWRVDEIVVITEDDVAVLCSEGHWGEILFFSNVWKHGGSIWSLICRRRGDRNPRGVDIVKCQ